MFRLGNTSPLEFFPKVTREVRSLLLSDLGNSFPLQTVFVSLFCLFLFLCCLKKKTTSAKRLGRRIWGFGVRPCFIRLFCEVTLDSNVGSSEFVGLLVVTRLDRVLEVFLESESYCGIPLVACLLSFSVLVRKF